MLVVATSYKDKIMLFQRVVKPQSRFRASLGSGLKTVTDKGIF